jgi:hypothetical protein
MWVEDLDKNEILYRVGYSSVRNTCMESCEVSMSYMHSYEYTCECGCKLTAEKHSKMEDTPKCGFCGNAMDMVFYLRSPDTRGE